MSIRKGGSCLFAALTWLAAAGAVRADVVTDWCEKAVPIAAAHGAAPAGLRTNLAKVFGLSRDKMRVVFLDGSGSYGTNGGDHVTADAVRTLAQETYAKVPRVTDDKPRARPQEPAQEAARTVTLADPRVEQPSVNRYYLVPSSTSARPGESEALEVLAHILGRGSNSRLYRSLVFGQGIAVSASASYDSTAVDATRLSVSAAPKPGTSLAQLEAALDAVLTEIIDKGVTGEELDRSKSRMIADAIYANDNQRTMAQWYGAALATGATVEDVRAWPERIRAVSADAVHQAARRWLDKRRSVTGYLVKDARPEDKRS